MMSTSLVQKCARFAKRSCDVLGSTVGIVALLPVLLASALVVKLTSQGPVFFHQERVGKNGRVFACFKFRTMKVGAQALQESLRAQSQQDGPAFKILNDPRITRVGRILRKYSIDELPQLLNVLRGEMSLVGPRPPIPEEVDRYEEWQRRRLEVVPGITGLWQVSGRSELSFDEWVMLDIVYIDTWSLGLDLQILARTLPAVLRRAGAY